jgi:hypothetical protein
MVMDIAALHLNENDNRLDQVPMYPGQLVGYFDE